MESCKGTSSSYHYYWLHGAYRHIPRACRLCVDAKFMCCIRQRYDALATDSDTRSGSGAHVFTLFVATLQRHVTSRPTLLGVSAQMQGTGDRCACERLDVVFALSQFVRRRGGGGYSSKCEWYDSLESRRNRNDPHRGRPEHAKCSDGSAMVRPSSLYSSEPLVPYSFSRHLPARYRQTRRPSLMYPCTSSESNAQLPHKVRDSLQHPRNPEPPPA